MLYILHETKRTYKGLFKQFQQLVDVSLNYATFFLIMESYNE